MMIILERLMVMVMMMTTILNKIFIVIQSSSCFVPLSVKSNYQFPEFKVECLFS